MVCQKKEKCCCILSSLGYMFIPSKLESREEKGTVAKILVIGDVCTGKTSIIQRYVYKTFPENHHATLGVDFALKRVRVEDTLLNVQMWDIAGMFKIQIISLSPFFFFLSFKKTNRNKKKKGGQERFIGLAPTYYKHAVAAIVVFDITQKDTLNGAKKWKVDVDEKVFLRNGDNIPVVLFANKWDLIEENESLRCLTDEELDAFCEQNHFEKGVCFEYCKKKKIKNLKNFFFVFKKKNRFTTSAKSGLNIKKGMNFIITKVMKNKKKLDQALPAESADPNRITADDLAKKNSPTKTKTDSKGCCTLV
ncbi:RAB32, member RAS oncogene family [Reticulomyxa filosa]|uniref:RAB32, member RAS oncogene family n=1 Tax=Reticulomyxa filosa TaxID=46433 RepID=X6NKK9_RETFI|nr:RAB32, member RAS oncogene family [Reticulomyxa filosa]|eukprot:ETO26526.1 RAB32, member RAS oncogene family [Reticulomyxa filosa]